MNTALYKYRRRGTIVHEAAIAIVLAGTLLTGLAQFLAFSAHQSRARQDRIVATREVADLLEQLMAHSWSQLDVETVDAMQPSPTCQTALRNPTLEITVTPDDGAKRIHVALHWKHASGNPEAPVQVVAWKHPPSETEQ